MHLFQDQISLVNLTQFTGNQTTNKIMGDHDFTELYLYVVSFHIVRAVPCIPSLIAYPPIFLVIHSILTHGFCRELFF